jgi:RHS repeat-associated protein
LRDGVGQDYAEQRYYNAGMGRFWSPDRGGGATANPGSLNTYAYTNGDPINKYDRHGREDDLPSGGDGNGGCWTDDEGNFTCSDTVYLGSGGTTATADGEGCTDDCCEDDCDPNPPEPPPVPDPPNPAKKHRRTYFLRVTKDCYDIASNGLATREIDYQLMTQEQGTNPWPVAYVISEHLVGDLPNSGATSSDTDTPGVYDDSQSVLLGKSTQTLTQTFTAGINGANYGLAIMGHFGGDWSQLNIVKHFRYVSINGNIGGEINSQGLLIQGTYTPCN